MFTVIPTVFSAQKSMPIIRHETKLHVYEQRYVKRHFNAIALNVVH